MDYEKKYKEVLERARKWYDANTNEGYRGIFEDLFPELKESEDEKIKRKILELVSISGNGNEWEEIYNWLKSLRPQYYWKPSEKEKVALRTAIHIMTEERNFPQLGTQLQNILDVFEGKSRADER